jgi:hypothetical protein
VFADLRKRPGLIAFVIGLLGVGFRVWLTAVDAPLTNSDEATMGLAALHIWRGVDFPVYFYGQNYMGTIEAYLSAPLIGLLGTTTLALRLPTLALYALFLFLAYALTKRVYSPWLGVVTVAFLALGSDRIIKNQLIAGGGYPETAPMLTALLLGVLLMKKRPRVWVAAGTGLLAGLILWNHWLPLPYLACAAVMLVAGTPWRAWWPAIPGLLVGLLPAIWHDLHSTLGHSMLGTFWFLQTTGTHPTAGQRFYGGALLGIPLGTGMCAPSHCGTWQFWWGPVYVALLLISAVLAWRLPRTPERSMRLVLTIGALLTIVSYVRNSSAGDSPIESARYYSCLLVSTPAWLEPIWNFLGAVARPAWQRLAAAVPLLGAAAMAVFATVALAAHAHVYTEGTADQKAVLAELQRDNVTRMYADYWTCDWISYQTAEDRICAVVGDDMHKGFNRYGPYWDQVQQSSYVAYLAPVGSPLDVSLAAAMKGTPVRAANYHIYLPMPSQQR